MLVRRSRRWVVTRRGRRWVVTRRGRRCVTDDRVVTVPGLVPRLGGVAVVERDLVVLIIGILTTIAHRLDDPLAGVSVVLLAYGSDRDVTMMEQ